MRSIDPQADHTEQTGSDAQVLATVWPYARPDAWSFLLALVITPLVAGLSLLQPWLVKRAIDGHVVPGQVEGLAGLGLAYLGTALGAYLCQVIYTVALSYGGTRTIMRLRSAIFRHVLSLSQRFFDGQPTGRLMTRITSDVDSLGDAISAGAVTIVLDVFMVVGVLGTMFWLHPGLTLLTLAMSPILVVAINLIRRSLRRLFIETREALAAVNAFMAERIDGVEIVQLYGQERLAAAQFDQRNRRFLDATTRSNVYESLMFSMVDGFSRVMVGVLVWFAAGGLGAWLGLDASRASAVMMGSVTVGTVVAFIDYLDRLFVPLRDASNKIATLQRAVAALVKITALLARDDRVSEGDQTLAALTTDRPEGAAADSAAGSDRGHIVMKDVHFAYGEDAPDVLRGVDLEVRPGEVVAIVGPTGSGKTTITRLLDRSYGGYRGSISLDGVELSELRRAALRRMVAAVRQDLQIFSEDVAFNVTLDTPGIGREQAEEAARLVHADRFIGALGWDHLLRERGADLSVGEGQLLTFARTMAHDPSVIILDEATASIDSLTEALIQDALQRIFERKTVIVIAHRLSTVVAADRICVMEAGHIVEQGNHAELLALHGRYAELIAAGEGVLA